MAELDSLDRAMLENGDVLILVNTQRYCIVKNALLLFDNEWNMIGFLNLIFEKPNVNGTLERTKSAPQAGKSAQNKRE